MIRATFNLSQLQAGGTITEYGWLNTCTRV